MDSVEKNRKIFAFAQKYLEENLPVGLSKADLEKYYTPDPIGQLKDMGNVYEQFLMSAQNGNRKTNVIKFNNEKPYYKKLIKGVFFDICGENFYDLDKLSVLDPEFLHATFEKSLKAEFKGINGKIWKDWCRTSVEIAIYLRKFSNVDNFKNFVAQYDTCSKKRVLLPDEIQKNIYGMGFALVCDALKELGFYNFSKPDTHIKHIFTSLGLSDNNPKHVFRDLGKLAEDNGVTPYKADKIFWLICSGYFYKDSSSVTGKHGMADDFIAEARNVVRA